MGYIFRVRMASFFAGAASALGLGLYVLRGDYIATHQLLSQQGKELFESLDGRITELEKLKQSAASPESQHPSE